MILRIFAFLLLCAPIAAAQPPPAQSAAELVERTFDEATTAVLAARDEVRASPDAAYQLIEKVLVPHIDFDLMARLVLGPHWRTASDEQRRRFGAAFQESLLRTYASVLTQNIDEIARRLQRERTLLVVDPVRAAPDAERLVVRTRLQLQEGPISIDYRLRAQGGGWQVYDVVIMNVSFVTNLRSEYDALLRRHDLDSVIQQLSERNRARAGG